MQEVKSFQDLDEKTIELILNFKPKDNLSKSAQDEILGLRNFIKGVIPLLSQDKKEILELRYSQNLSCEEIEKKTGKSKQEILDVLARGIEEIKENIRKKRGALKSQNESIASATSFDYKKNILWMSGFLVMGAFILVIIFSFNLVQNYFFGKSGFLNRLAFNIKSTIQETNVNKLSTLGNPVHQIYQGDPDKLNISGSTSLLVLSDKWQAGFGNKFPKCKINLISSDSESGIDSLIDGKTDIANSSRPVTFTDQKRASANGVELSENRVALDALVVLLNKKNNIEELSLDELKNIFSGEIKNWQELGGPNIPVFPIAREQGSGTNDFVVNRILQGNSLPATFLRIKSNQEIVKYIQDNEGAISFTNSTNYPWSNNQIKYLKIKTYENSPSVSPYEAGKLNEKAMRYGDYPLSHYLYLITFVDPPKKVQDYVDWVLSPEGQKVVKSLGLISVVEE